MTALKSYMLLSDYSMFLFYNCFVKLQVMWIFLYTLQSSNNVTDTGFPDSFL